jgi:hypothetical protein
MRSPAASSARLLQAIPAQWARLRSSYTPRRNKCRNFHFQSPGQNHQFRVRDASQLRLDFREGGAAQFQAQHGAPGREHLLRQSSLVPQFSDLRAGNVLRTFSSFCHAPELELDNIGGGAFNCSDFGATCRNVSDKAFHMRRRAKRERSSLTSFPPIVSCA